MNINIVIIFDALTKIATIACATYAACYFKNPKLLWFCLLTVLMGHSYESKKVKVDDGKVKEQ